MIKISHEFPNDFYQKGYAEAHTDYDYCLIHRYLDTPSYAEYMRNSVKKGRMVYLDNGVYELGTAFDINKYIDVILELKPAYYMLPDVFNAYETNLESQLDFYQEHSQDIFDKVGSLPIGIPHGSNISDLHNSLRIMDTWLTLPGARIAIPFGSMAFENHTLLDAKDKRYNPYKGYMTEVDIPYTPVRQAINRKKFVQSEVFKYPNREFHLLGCKSVCEFDDWGMDDSEIPNIASIDTSLPVAMAFECLPFIGFHACSPEKNTHFYKPTFLIDKNFDLKCDCDEYIMHLMNRNIDYFKQRVNSWSNSNYKR